MQLRDAISKAVNNFGEVIVKEPRLVAVLSDYNAFEENYEKNILKQIYSLNCGELFYNSLTSRDSNGINRIKNILLGAGFDSVKIDSIFNEFYFVFCPTTIKVDSSKQEIAPKKDTNPYKKEMENNGTIKNLNINLINPILSIIVYSILILIAIFVSDRWWTFVFPLLFGFANCVESDFEKTKGNIIAIIILHALFIAVCLVFMFYGERDDSIGWTIGLIITSLPMIIIYLTDKN